MSEKSVMERMMKPNSETEIWWDSSPLAYDNWKKMIDQAIHEKRAELGIALRV